MTIESTVLELASTLGIALTDIHNIYANAISGIAVINMVAIFLFITLMLIAFRVSVAWIIKRNITSGWDRDHERDTLIKFDSDDFFSLFVMVTITLFTLLISITIFSDTFQRFAYPEYFAIKEMLSLLGVI